MDKARYLVEAHLLEGRSVSELAAAHGVHRSWIYKLLARYKAGGYGARQLLEQLLPHRHILSCGAVEAEGVAPLQPGRFRMS